MPRININQFRGMNRLHARSRIEDSEAWFIANFDVTEANYLRKRPGVEQIAANTRAERTRPLIQFRAGIINDILYLSGQNIYKTNTSFSSDTDINSSTNSVNAQWAVQYVNTAYIIHSNIGVYSWDGTTWTVAAGSFNGSQGVIHKDRLFMIHSTSTTSTNKSKIFFTDVGDISNTGFSGNTLDINSGDGDWLTRLVVYNDAIIAFKSRSTWIVYVDAADPADWEIKILNPALGAICRDAVTVHENLIYFGALFGVYRTDGTTFEELSEPIRHDFSQRDLDPSEFTNDQMVVSDQKLYFYRRPSGSDTSAVWWVFGIKSEAWWTYYLYDFYDTGSSTMSPYGFLSVDFLDYNDIIWGNRLTSDSGLYKFDDTVGDDESTTFDCVWESKIFDFGEPAVEKHAERAYLHYLHPAAMSYTWQYSGGQLDETGTVAGSTSILSDQATVEQIEAPLRFNNVAFDLSFEDTATKGDIYGLTIEMEETPISGTAVNA